MTGKFDPEIAPALRFAVAWPLGYEMLNSNIVSTMIQRSSWRVRECVLKTHLFCSLPLLYVVHLSEWVSVTTESEPTTNFVDFDPIYSPIWETLPETEFSSECTGTLLFYIFGPSVVKYGIPRLCIKLGRWHWDACVWELGTWVLEGRDAGTYGTRGRVGRGCRDAGKSSIGSRR